MRIATVLAASAIVLAPASLSAQAPNGVEFQVNTYTTTSQQQPSVARDASGNFVVVWTGQDASNFGIIGQRYASTGAPRGSEFQINTYTTNAQAGPVVATEADGDFVVVWASVSQDGSGTGLFGQRFDSAGAALGSEFQVNTYTTNLQYFHAVDARPSGGFVVVWASAHAGDPDYGVVGRRYDSAGSPLGAEFLVNTYTTGIQIVPDVVVLGNGAFNVVWDSVFSQDGSSDGVFGQRYNSSGGAVGNEFQVNTHTTGAQTSPAVAATGAGGFVAAWESSSQDGSPPGIFAKRYDSAASPVGTEFQVNTYTTGAQSGPKVSSNGKGDFVVVWESSDGSSTGVIAQRFSSSGTTQGTEFQVNTYTTNNQDSPTVAGAEGGFVVAWTSNGQDGSAYGVFGQRFGWPLCEEPLVFNGHLLDDDGGVDGLNAARVVEVGPDGGCVYLTSFGDDAVAVFQRDPLTGDLTWKQKVTDGTNLVNPAGFDMSSDGKHIYIAAEGTVPGRVRWFNRSSDCILTGGSLASDSLLNGTRDVAISPDGVCLYAAASTADALVAYKRNSTSGGLTFVEAKVDGSDMVDGLDGASSVAVTTDNLCVYVASDMDHAVAVFEANPTTCALDYVEREKDGQAGVDGLDGAAAVDTSSDGMSVYVAGHNDDALAVFRRDSAATCGVSFQEMHEDGVDGVNGLNGAVSVAVSPSDFQVYVAGRLEDAVAAFARETSTGRLAFTEVEFDETGSVEGLHGARGVAVSPNGSHVYAAGEVDNAVAWFDSCCGNNEEDAGEDCDDDNLANGDCCSAGCRFETTNSCCVFEVCNVGFDCVPLCGLECMISGGSCVCQ